MKMAVTFVASLRLVVPLAAALLAADAAAAQTPAVPSGQPPSPPAAAAPAEPEVSAGVEVDLVSRYLWRSIPYSYQGKVVWTTAWVSTRGFTFSAFMNGDERWRPHINEVDFVAAYERTLGKVTLTGSYNLNTYYYDPSSINYRTSELIGRIDFAAGPGQIFTSHAVDVQHYKGAYYAEVGYAAEREVAPKWTLAGDGSVAFWGPFSRRYFSDPDFYDPPIPSSTLGPLTVNVSLSRQLTDLIAVRPHVTFSRVLDRTTREAFDSYDRDIGGKVNSRGVVVGVAVTIGR
jgi:hypothetical protein